MGKLTYLMLASLDGYSADKEGNFEWAAPDEEVHAFVNNLEQNVGTYLLGRRMYEVMTFWETVHTMPNQAKVALDFAELWRATDKVVYSRTLQDASTARTRIERQFDAEQVRQMKASAGARPVHRRAWPGSPRV